MREALAQAGVTPEEVAVVFASANSSIALDRVEAAALAQVFGPSGVPVVALKGAIGECSAAAAGSLVAAILALRSGTIPPTAGYELADPDCPVDVSRTARPLAPRHRTVALVNSFASGGANFSFVVRS